VLDKNVVERNGGLAAFPRWASMIAWNWFLPRLISRRWRFQRDGAVGLEMHGGARRA
jgi:hypothetical protein